MHLRRQQDNRFPLPSVILGNVQSLRKELGELQERQFPERFQEQRCVMAFPETWLTEQDQDVHFLINGFGAPSRWDRDTRVTGKSQGGGVCLYVNKCYCSPVTIRECICTQTLNFNPRHCALFYRHHEFPQLFITIVYIQPNAHPSCFLLWDLLTITVHFLPIHKTLLKRDKTRTKDVDIWSEESVLILQEIF